MTCFKNKKILIVGGSSGVGLAAARKFVARDARVVIASSSESRLSKALAQLGSGVEGMVLDVTRDTDVAELDRDTLAFDHVVVSIGGSPVGSLRATAIDDARRAMDTKFWGSYRIARAARISPSGSLTLVSGYLAARPNPTSAVQSAVNGALEALARALALEFAPVRVNSVSPGLLDTPYWARIGEEQRQGMFLRAAGRLPVGRVGAPEDIADAIIFVAGADYMTGSTLYMDGGGCVA